MKTTITIVRGERSIEVFGNDAQVGMMKVQIFRTYNVLRKRHGAWGVNWSAFGTVKVKAGKTYIKVLERAIEIAEEENKKDNN